MLKLDKLFFLLICVLCISTARASNNIQEPASLSQVQDISYKYAAVEKDKAELEMRREALKETAMSYGALSGLAHRNWEIYHVIQRQEIVLDVIFDFSKLLIPTHYGAMIEPPIISESENAFLLDDNGMTASMTSKIYSIGENARIVTTPRNWRSYLIDKLDLENAEVPDLILRPRNTAEKSMWDNNIEKGWTEGEAQANDIFEDNLGLLLSDYIGMVRYRKLLAQKMVSEPYAVKENRGVTGDSNEMRIDDKAVIITSIPALNPSSDKWEPTER